MTSQLHHYFQACQAVHGTDSITNPHFQSQVDSLNIYGPQVDILITKVGWGAQPCSLNLAFPKDSNWSAELFGPLGSTGISSGIDAAQSLADSGESAPISSTKTCWWSSLVARR